MVIREKNIQPAAHAARKKATKTGTPCQGYTGLPCPVGYKYGSLALQGGGWAKDRQPFTLREYLTLREINCDLGAGRLIGTDLGSVKRLIR